MTEIQDADNHLEQSKMLPPPVGDFQSREDLLKHVREFALTQGYVVSIKDSSKDRYVTISCDRSGVYRKRLKSGENLRQRKAPSRLTNCPFEVMGKKDDDLWTLTVKNANHNHEPSKDISDHPSCRRFTEEEVLIIRDMTANGKRPRQILKVLRQSNPNLVSDSRNVYNVKAKIRKEILSGNRMESPSMSSSGTGASEPAVLNGLTVEDSCHAYLETNFVKETKGLVSELCRHFYTLGWLSGTGGSLTIRVHDDSIPKPRQLIIMSCSGVHKERMVPEDMYVLSSDGYILCSPIPKPYPHNPPKCTDCAPLFLKAYEIRNSGAVIHSHAMEACLATMIHPTSKEFKITHMEMIKGIEGHGYHDELVVPIIENTAHEGELTASFTEAIIAYPKTTAVLVRNHGVYIWGDSWISAKTQAECYHYLFDAAIKLHQLGLDWSTPGHGPIRNNGVCECGGNTSRALKGGYLGLNYVIEPSQLFILLDIEGTTTPISFVTNVLLPYANNNAAKHFAGPYDSEQTQEDTNLLRSQDQIWRSGFSSNELVGVVFDDVPEVLERWHALGVKVYIYSSGSKEAHQRLFANSNYGDLRKYMCGFFDTTMGSKNEAASYLEILRTVGVDRPSEMLFVTSIMQDAVAARAVGMEVAISIRPGNEPLPENHGFRTIESFVEL